MQQNTPPDPGYRQDVSPCDHYRFEHRTWQTCRHLIVEDWGDDCSVFCPATGETHLLSALPNEILQELSATDSTTEELAASLARSCEIACTPEWLRKIADILRELANLELIEHPTTSHDR